MVGKTASASSSTKRGIKRRVCISRENKSRHNLTFNLWMTWRFLYFYCYYYSTVLYSIFSLFLIQPRETAWHIRDISLSFLPLLHPHLHPRILSVCFCCCWFIRAFHPSFCLIHPHFCLSIHSLQVTDNGLHSSSSNRHEFTLDSISTAP